MNRTSLTSTVIAGAALLATAASGRVARAEDQPAPVDVTIHEARPHRTVAVEWNPLALLVVERLSANVIITPKNHHSLILSPFYAWTSTQPIYVFSDTGVASQLPVQHFSGWGGELGYRYYFAEGGPRGLFVGPSLILGDFTATPQVGPQVQYLQWGVAADVGYEMLVADSVALSLGAGVQYTDLTKDIPNQQFPAELYANAGVRPRVLLALGWAF